MNNTREFLDLKNPVIIKIILESVDRTALIIFLEQRFGCNNKFKGMTKKKLIDEVIKTFDLQSQGCNKAKKCFYDKVLCKQPNTSYSLSNTDRSLLTKLVNTEDKQIRNEIINKLDEESLRFLGSDFGIKNSDRINIQALKNIFTNLSNKPQRQQLIGYGYDANTDNSPVVTRFLNAKTVAERREMMNTFNLDQLIILAKYFGTVKYQNETKESIMKQLLYNVPPPNGNVPRPNGNVPRPVATVITPPTNSPTYGVNTSNTPPYIEDSPVVTRFLNAKTIAERREMLKIFNRDQLIILAKYFGTVNYYFETTESIMKQLLFNVPPPVITSNKLNVGLSDEKIIEGFRNSQTIATRKDFLNMLDRRGIFVLANHFGLSNYKRQPRQDIINKLLYNVPATPIFISKPACNINQAIGIDDYSSEKERKLIKAYMNANPPESKKKLLNSLSRDDLVILAQKLQIHDTKSLSDAQLREQVFSNNTGGMSPSQMFELSQNLEQRKSMLKSMDKRELMMIAKKYNIININKMPAESIREKLYDLPYVGYSSPMLTSTGCQISSEMYPQSPNQTTTACQINSNVSSLARAARLPPPIDLGDKIITPFQDRTPSPARVVPVSQARSQSVVMPPVTQARPPLTQARPPVTQARPPVTQARPPVTQARPPVTQARPPVTQARPPSVAIQPTITRTSFTRSPVRIISVSPKLSSNMTSAGLFQTPVGSPVGSQVGSTDSITKTNAYRMLTEGYIINGKLNTPVGITNLTDNDSDFYTKFDDLLENIHVKYGKTRAEAIKNKKIIKSILDDYLNKNPSYDEAGKQMTTNTNSFIYNGVVLLDNIDDDNNNSTSMMNELKRKFTNINWNYISGVVGVGLVYLYGQSLQYAANQYFGNLNPDNSTYAAYNLPRGVFYDQNGVCFQEPPGIGFPATTAVGFPATTAVGFPATTAVGFPASPGVCFPPTEVGFPLATDPSFFLPAPPTAVGFPATDILVDLA